MLEALVLTEFFKCEIQIWSTRSLEEKMCLGATGFLFARCLEGLSFSCSRSAFCINKHHKP